NNIVMLTADAFGVLPPIAKLTPEQAMRYFLLGYTAKVAGTEAGLTQPEATFSPCFGAPFMARHPRVYAEMLGRKIKDQNVSCWLINTGWSGGPYGVGSRMDIDATRAMLNAALDGNLDDVPYATDAFFGLSVPQSCPGVDASVLNPASTWGDENDYAESARSLAKRFNERYAQMVSEAAA
ncbi:MAG: phosphoenolpyruvate carboxykinase (ATP), partial [Zetaproteobacteria bacterium CG_4_8_14_3_um_filter_59_5]